MDSTKVRRPRRAQSYKSAAGPEVGTTRTTYPGYAGPGSLKSLAQGFMENKHNGDLLEEQQLFTVSAEVTQLLEGLNKLETKDETEAQ